MLRRERQGAIRVMCSEVGGDSKRAGVLFFEISFGFVAPSEGRAQNGKRCKQSNSLETKKGASHVFPTERLLCGGVTPLYPLANISNRQIVMDTAKEAIGSRKKTLKSEGSH